MNALEIIPLEMGLELKGNLNEVERQKLARIKENEPPSWLVTFKTVVALVGETTANGFKRLRDKIIEDFLS